jgi:hypothetical protein
MAVDRNANSDSRQRRALQRLLASGQLHTHVADETPTGAVDGVNFAFLLANTPKAGTVQVFLNGILQTYGGANDYVIAGKTIAFVTVPFAGDTIRVWYQRAA